MTSDKLGKGDKFLKEMSWSIDEFVEENKNSPLLVMIECLQVSDSFKKFLMARANIEDIKYHAKELEDSNIQQQLYQYDWEHGITFLPIREEQMTISGVLESL